MPAHMTPTLFADLALPEVEIEPQIRNAEPLDSTALGVRQAMQELTPGRVTKRFAPRRAIRHWVPVKENETEVDINSFLLDPEDAGLVTYSSDGGVVSVPCVRPVAARLEQAPDWIRSSQNAQLIWHSELLPTASGQALELPLTSNWTSLVEDVRIYMHGTRNEVEVRRFATGARADHPRQRDESIDVTFIRRDGDTAENVAVGYSFTADAIQLRLRKPADWPSTQALNTALRAAWFRHRLQTAPALPDTVNYFGRDWLATLYLATITGIATRQDCSTADARTALEAAGIGQTLRAAMDVIFKAGIPSQTASDNDDDDGATADSDNPADAGWSSPGLARIADLLADHTVCDVIHEVGASLNDAHDSPSDEFLSRVFAATVGAAFLEAFQRLCPTLDVSPLLLDLSAGPENPVPEGYLDVWLTEDVVGGAGVVEEVARRSSDDPRLLLRLAEAALSSTDHERVDTAIRVLSQASVTDDQMQAAIASARLAGSPAERRDRLLGILQLLPALGASAGRTVATAVAARTLRPGATPELDSILHRLVTAWNNVEARVGFEAEPRALAYALRDEFVGELETAVGAPSADMGAEWRFAQLYSMLWPSGVDARAAGLATYSPFDDLPRPERMLIQPYLSAQTPVIRADSTDWRAQVDEALRTRGQAILTSDAPQREIIREALLDLALVPVDIDILATHPRIVGLTLDDDRTTVELDLTEIV
jgi:hypothetical protein